MTILKGNIVTEKECFYGSLEYEADRISGIVKLDNFREGEAWVLPGFIDVHTHACGPWEEGVGIAGMASFEAQYGVTGFCPTMSTDCHEKMVNALRYGKEAIAHPAPNSSRVLGTHLEGPFLDAEHKGGMPEEWLRNPDIAEAKSFLAEADGTLRMMTIAAELPGAVELTSFLHENGVTVSCGHSGCSKVQLDACIEAGLSEMCHVFDAYDGRNVDFGVSKPCLTDSIMIDDRLYLEFICDGIHVPAELVILMRRAAGASRMIAITDSLQGAGLPDDIYTMPDGRKFTVTNGDVARLLDDPNSIVGSCLTMNRAFANMLEKFGFTPVEACLAASSNPARSMGVSSTTGRLEVGLLADIAILKPGTYQVEKTILAGREIYGK